MKNKLANILGAVICAGTVFTSGCSLKPVPGDYQHLGKKTVAGNNVSINSTTKNIVQQIRCEARQAIAIVSLGYVDETLLDIYKNGRTEATRQFAANFIEDGQVSFGKLIQVFNPDTNEFDEELIRFWEQEAKSDDLNPFKLMEGFANSGVGYTFTFTVSEENNASSGLLDFKFPYSNGTRDLALGGSYERKRQNKRSFSIAETIRDIVFDPDLAHCDEKSSHLKENYHFPIYGKIGLAESFQTYADLILRFGLGETGKIDFVNTKVKKNLIDEIEFTTTLVGSANPSIELSGGSGLAKASIGLSNKRTDVHQLTLIIQPDKLNSLIEDLTIERALNQNNTILQF